MPRLRVIYIFTFLLAFLLLSGCGYRPSSQYAKSVMGDKVSTHVSVDLKYPENSVIIKDAVDSAIIKRFKSSLTTRAYADTHLDVLFSSMSFVPLQYDSNGYVIAYRATIALKITKSNKESSRVYMAKGTYDFAIEPNAVLSDQSRFEAINFGSQKAIDSFVAQVAATGSRRDDDN